MRIRNVEDLEGRCALLGRYGRLNRWLVNWWKRDFPLMLRIVRVIAGITDDEAADLRWSHIHLLQNVYDLTLKVVSSLLTSCHCIIICVTILYEYALSIKEMSRRAITIVDVNTIIGKINIVISIEKQCKTINIQIK